MNLTTGAVSELAKDDPRLRAIHEELLRQFDAGRQTAVAYEEIEDLLRLRAGA